jgi:hypothetical protein
MSNDILKLYPQAKTHPDMPTMETTCIKNPGSYFSFYPYFPRKDRIVTWNLRPCSGSNCQKNMRKLYRDARTYLQEKTGAPFDDL